MKKNLILLLFVASFVLYSCQSNNVDFSMSVFSDDDNFEYNKNQLSNYDITTIDDNQDKILIFEEVNLANLVDSDSLFNLVGIEKEFNFPYYYYTFSLNNFENIDYLERYINIQVFGRVVETNGDFNENENSVEFDLTQSEDYYVTFKDFFILSFLRGTHNLESKESNLDTISLSFEEKVETLDSGGSNQNLNMKILPLSLIGRTNSNGVLNKFYLDARISPGSGNIPLDDLVIEVKNDENSLKIENYEIVNECNLDDLTQNIFQVVYVRDSYNEGLITRTDLMKICFKSDFENKEGDEINFYFYVQNNEKVNINLLLPNDLSRDSLILYP